MMDNLELKALFHCVAEHQDPPVRWDWKEGICDNSYELYSLDIISQEQMKRIEALMWECAGEDTAYPVPASHDAMHGRTFDEKEPPRMACYWMWEDQADIYTGTYGRSRREMCRYIAENLK